MFWHLLLLLTITVGTLSELTILKFLGHGFKGGKGGANAPPFDG